MFRRFVVAFGRQHFILVTQIFRNVHDYCHLEMGLSMTSAHFYSILLLSLQLHPNCSYQAPVSLPSSTAAGASLAEAIFSTRLQTLSSNRHAID